METQKLNKKSLLAALAFIVLCIAPNTKTLAQETIKGFILDISSSEPLWNATIKNIRTQQQAQTQKDGAFTLSGRVNDYFEVYATGYIKDTIFYYENSIRRIYLNRDERIMNIDEVLVKRLTDNRLAQEIAKAQNAGKVTDASPEKGGLRISPSRIFGRSARQARSNLTLLLLEQNNRKVDRIFTSNLIASITDLNPDDIALFRELYRPSLSFVEKASPEDLKAYISDSYSKFKKRNN